MLMQMLAPYAEGYHAWLSSPEPRGITALPMSIAIQMTVTFNYIGYRITDNMIHQEVSL